MGRVMEVRAWCGSKMLYGPYDTQPCNDEFIGDTWARLVMTLEEANAELELMWFTGLFDKNKVKIWEGDIVEFHKESWNKTGLGYKPFIRVVKWNDEITGFDPWIEAMCDDLTYTGQVDLDVCEVIGNIFTHPELLEQTEDAEGGGGQ